MNQQDSSANDPSPDKPSEKLDMKPQAKPDIEPEPSDKVDAAAHASSPAPLAEDAGSTSLKKDEKKDSRQHDEHGKARPRARRRKWVWIVLALAALLVVFRISLIWLVPWLVDRAVRPYGLAASLQRIDLNILGTEAGVWQLELSPKEGGEPFGSIAYLRADLNTLALLTGRLHVIRAEAEGVDLHIQRQGDGRLPLLDRILSSLPDKQEEEQSHPLTFAPPIRIDALRLNQINVVFTDAAVLPKLETDIRLNFALSYLDAPSQPADFTLELRARSLVEYLLVDGQFTTSADNLQAHLNIDMQGLSPHAIAGYLRQVGLSPDAQRLDAQLQSQVDLAIVRPDGASSNTAGKQPVASSQPRDDAQPASAADELAQGTTALRGSIKLGDIRLEADRRPAARLDRLDIDLSTLTGHLLSSARIELQGVYAKAGRDAQGQFTFAGLKQASLPPEEVQARGKAPSSEENSATPASTQPARQASGRTFSWRLGALGMKDVQLVFEDLAVKPAAAMAVKVDSLSLTHQGSEALGPASTVLIQGQGSLPGLARAFKIEGLMHPFQTPLDLDSRLAVQGIDLQAMTPYLTQAGLASELDDASLALRLQATWTPRADHSIMASLKLQDLELRNAGGERPLGALGLLQIDELHLDPAGRRVGVRAVRLTDTTSHVIRHDEGGLSMLGLRILPASADRAVATTAPAVATPATSPASHPLDVLELLPAIDVGRFEWNGVDLLFEDHLASPATRSHVTDASLQLEAFRFDPQVAWRDAQAGSYRLHLGWLEGQGKLELAGRIQLGHDGGKVGFDLQSQGIDTSSILPAAVAPNDSALVPSIRQGKIDIAGFLQAQQKDERSWQLSAHLDRLAMTEEGRRVLSLNALDLQNLSLRGLRLKVDQLKVDQPHLVVRTLEDGRIKLPGLMYQPAVSPQPAPAATPGQEQPWDAWLSQLDFAIELAQADVTDATVTWHRPQAAADGASADDTLEARASLRDVIFSPEQAQGRFEAAVRVESLLESLVVQGRLAMTQQTPTVTLDVQSQGMNLRQLAERLPLPVGLPIEIPWQDASLKLTAHAGIARHEQGGLHARAGIDDLVFADSASPQPLVAFDESLIDIARFDPAAESIDIRQMRLQGLVSSVERRTDGKLVIAGLVLGGQAADAPAASIPAATGVTLPEASSHEASPAPATQPASPEPDLLQLLARRDMRLPLVKIETLELGVTKLAVTDHLRHAAPLELADLKLTNLRPLAFFGSGSPRPAPARLQLTVTPAPVARQLTVRMLLRPFEENVLLGMAVEAQGIDGQGLTEVLPELAAFVDGRPLTQGHFKTRLMLTGRVERANPLVMDFSRGGRFNLYVGQTQFRLSPDGVVLAGVEEIHAQPIEISPGWQEVQVRQLDVLQLSGNAWRDGQGTHLLGMRLGPLAATQANASASVPADSLPSPAAMQPSPSEDSPLHVRINRLTVSGLDATFEDRTHTPITVLPLTGLDVEARNLSNQLEHLRRPMRFNVLLTAGKVNVPVRQQGRGLLGALGDTANLLRGKGAGDTAQQMVRRDLFSLITLTGQIQSQPQTQGWVKLSVQGLELWALRGLASDAGVTINSGVLDVNTDARLKPDGTIDTRSRIILGDLSISEPANGPIARHLALPAPLDTVIMAVKSPNGSITLPINVTLRQGRVSTDQIITQTLAATANVIAKAFASSPIKLAQGVTGFVGLGGLTELAGLGGAKPAAVEPITIRFTPGDATLSSRNRQALDEVIRLLRKDDKLSIVLRSYLSEADVAIAHQRANPTSQEVAQLASELDARLAALTQERARTAGVLRAAIAAGASRDVREGMTTLRQLDRQIVRLRQSQANLHDLLRPGAQRLASRRTRDAAVAMSDQRMQWLSQQLEQSGVKNIQGRVQLTPATYNPAAAAEAAEPASSQGEPDSEASTAEASDTTATLQAVEPADQGSVVITFTRSQ